MTPSKVTDYKGKRVVIMGLGLNEGGLGAAKFFSKAGAKVLVTDIKPKEQLRESIKKLSKFKIKYTLGGHKEDDFKSADLIIKNPAVPLDNKFLKIARDNNIPIETDINIFFELCAGKIIGITGTKGKSTVSSLVRQLLAEKFANVYLAGNIGVSPLDFVKKIKKNSFVVLELSSFELEDLKYSPHIAVITNIFEDHLDRHKNMGGYVSAKANIFNRQKEGDYLILNYDNSATKKLGETAKSKALFFSLKVPLDNQLESFACYLKDNDVFFGNDESPLFKIDSLKILGTHNISNALAAASVARLCGVESKKIEKSIKKFKGIPNRQEFLRELRGVKYYNDTAATMPEAAIEAIKTFKAVFPRNRLILIAGGQDKGLNYDGLASQIENNVDCVIFLPGTATEKIAKKIKVKEAQFASSMKEAVKLASSIAKKGDIVVLSPGGTSFNLFKNEFDRGRQFIAEVKALK